MSRYRLAMFDFDGTLADSMAWFARTMPTVAERHGLARLDAAEWDAMRGLDARTIMARLRLPWWKLPRVTREMRRRMRDDIDGIALFPGIDALFAALERAGVQIAVVTSNSEDNVRRVLGEELLAHVDALACGVSVFGKRAKLASTIRRCGRTRAESVYVGDEIRDAEAAAALGIDFLGVAWGYTRPDALADRSRSPVSPDPAALCEAILGERSPPA